MYKELELVVHKVTGKTMLVLEVTGDTLTCSFVKNGKYVLDSCKSHEVDSIVVHMARYMDEQNKIKAEALARKKQEEISARLEAQRLKKNEV